MQPETPVPDAATPGPPSMSAWRFVAWFGVVALFADVVYEGARSITGPLLAHLGATAAVVGVVTGVGEAAALVLRLVSGPMTDRTRAYWSWTLAGYALTVVSVPLLGLASVLWVAAGLVIAERVGKAVRSPAKDTLLSHAASVTGRGKGFALHEALDQVGALSGPLIVAAMLALTHDDYTPSLLVLAVPGAIAFGLAVWLRTRVPDPWRYEVEVAPQPRSETVTAPAPLPRVFWAYAAFAGLTMAGFATFGVLSFHLVTAHVLTAAAVPLVYAGAMVVDALAAVASGLLYDRVGAKVLFVLPALAAVVPLLAYSTAAGVAVAGAMVWGAALGVQESTLRAAVAGLVGPGRRATAYGLFGAVLGVAAAAGGALAGSLYESSLTLLSVVTAALQVLAALVLAAVLVSARRHREPVSR